MKENTCKRKKITVVSLNVHKNKTPQLNAAINTLFKKKE